MTRASNAKKLGRHGVDAGLLEKQVARLSKDRMGRRRVCERCRKPGDVAYGGVHSELPCDRCGVVPCAGVIIDAEVEA